MTDLAERIRSYYEAAADPISAKEILAPATRLEAVRPIPPRIAPARPRPWPAVVGFVAALLAIGGVALLIRAGDPSETELASTAPAPTTSPTAEAWNPILSVTVANPAPPAASCPEGTDPDAAGPVEQPRPWGADWSNQAAVFDRHTGKILFMDERGDTWAFDVCTNTWLQVASGDQAPSGTEDWSGTLVYDVDSDVTVSFAGDVVSVFDAATNSWARISQASAYEASGGGAVYDPVSGLIVVQTDQGLAAYDVDTDTWTPLRVADEEVDAADFDTAESVLIGYVAETDQFAFVGNEQGCLLVDARTGAITVMGLPFDSLSAGFGRLHYATGTGPPTLIDTMAAEDSICRLEWSTTDWICADLAGGPGPFTGSAGAGLLAAVVQDPINDRTVLIYGYGPGFEGSFYNANDIWAVDFETAEWTLLLERSGGMTTERTIDNRS